MSFQHGNNDLSTDVTFESRPPSDCDPDEMVFWRRGAANLAQQNYLLTGNCSEGYTNGALAIFDEVTDCSRVEAAITDKLNP